MRTYEGGTFKDSPEFHNLTGAIAAYGKALSSSQHCNSWKNSTHDRSA